MTEQVVLVPGLWMPAMAMAFLGSQLARRGYAVKPFGYRGRSSFEANVERFARFARQVGEAGRPHYVGHSLGGVLILDALERHPQLPAASAVLLGAPVRGCHAGRRLGRARVGRWMGVWAQHDLRQPHWHLGPVAVDTHLPRPLPHRFSSLQLEARLS